jgi:hypothetical protein
MKFKVIIFVLVLFLSTNVITGFGATVQKKRKGNPKPAPSNTLTQPAPIIPVRVRLNSGREVAGRLVDINLKTLSIDPGNGLIFTASMQEVSTMTLGDTKAKADPDLLKDADSAYRALLSLSIATDGNVSYSEYQPKLNEAKTAVELFISKHEKNANKDLIRSMRTAVNSFEMVLPVWSLRVGQEQHKYLTDSSKQMQPILQMFPDIKQVNWKQNERYPIEKVIAWVWIQATRLVEDSKKQLSQLR